MSNVKTSIKSYFRHTRSLLYSYLISLPLLLLYEGLIFISQPDANHIVRISVDAWTRALFKSIGTNALSLTLILVALVGLFILYYERRRLSSLRISYFIGMIFEALVYAIVLALLISDVVGYLTQMIASAPVNQLSTLQRIALSLGAGLYEELFFRVILVTLLMWIFKLLVSRRWMAYAGAMITAALLFSLAHYIGNMAYPFTFASFLFRFLFGLALNAIYIWRGFGMAAWTHALYDLLVVVFA